jgi:UDP-N-acetylglucosamine 2-epimerase
MKILSIVGARPQFIKLMPLVEALKKRKGVCHVLLHTGQHYDYTMSKVFFDELAIPKPKYHLGVGSGSHGHQTGEMLKRIENVLVKERPDVVVVFGDTNSTLAGALAATKMHIPVVHIEAGLRSFNKSMPEEINRVITDHVSDALFCPTEIAIKNLRDEGFYNIAYGSGIISLKKINSYLRRKEAFVVKTGDIMQDSLNMSLGTAQRKSSILNRLKLRPYSYSLVTLHRVENTDNRRRLKVIVNAIKEISKTKTIVWPIHPRTRKALGVVRLPSSLKVINPAGYFDMLILEKNACKIITDSGGVQKEAWWLGIPCVTIREQTEWIETLKNGRNRLVSADRGKIIKAIKDTSVTILDSSIKNQHKVADLMASILIERYKRLVRKGLD